MFTHTVKFGNPLHDALSHITHASTTSKPFNLLYRMLHLVIQNAAVIQCTAVKRNDTWFVITAYRRGHVSDVNNSTFKFRIILEQHMILTDNSPQVSINTGGFFLFLQPVNLFAQVIQLSNLSSVFPVPLLTLCIRKLVKIPVRIYFAFHFPLSAE